MKTPWSSDLKLGIAFALQSVFSSPRRTLLACIGVGIGFSAVQAMLIIGQSIDAEMRNSLSRMGGDIVALSIKRFEDSGTSSFNLSGLKAIVDSMPEVKSSAWTVKACIQSNGDGSDDVHAIPPEAQTMLGLHVQAGRALLPSDKRQNNAVLGSELFERLRVERPYLSVGSQLPICNQQMRIVGVLHPSPFGDLFGGINFNESAFVAEHRLNRDYSHSHLLIKVDENFSSQSVTRALRSRIEQLVPEFFVSVEAAWDLLRFRHEQQTLYTSFLAVLGAVSLLVGILGIVNMQFSAVSERRAEIGLRIALGASERDILIQFLVESVLLCLLGAAVGTVFGVSAAYLALQMEGLNMTIPLSILGQATALAVLCGLFAGVLPARKAAKVDPNSSLRDGT